MKTTRLAVLLGIALSVASTTFAAESFRDVRMVEALAPGEKLGQELQVVYVVAPGHGAPNRVITRAKKDAHRAGMERFAVTGISVSVPAPQRFSKARPDSRTDSGPYDTPVYRSLISTRTVTLTVREVLAAN